MAREKIKTRLPVLTSDDLIRLAYDLRNIGFHIDIRHFIDAHRADDILLGLEVQGELKDTERLKTILAPIFCRTPEEQTTFYTFFDSWLSRNVQIRERFKEAGGRLERKLGTEKGTENFLVRHKYWFIGIVFFLILAVFGHPYLFPPPEPGIWLQGKVVDYKTGAPVKEVSVKFNEREAQTDNAGFFDFGKFQGKTTGDLTFIHPAYLAKTLSGKTTTTRQGRETFQLYRQLDNPRTVVVEVKDKESGTPVTGAEVTFLNESKRTDGSGKASLHYRQEENTARIEVTHDGYLKNTQTYQLHGYDNATVAVALEKSLTAEEVSVKKLVDNINKVELVKQDGAWKKFYEQHHQEILMGSALLPFLFLFGWLFRRWYRKPVMLEREATMETLAVDYVTVEWLADFVFKNPQLRRIIQQFRQHRESSDFELDTEATIHRTLNNGGLFTPAYRSRFVTPEYLVLIDRASFDDQQAKYVDEIIDRFTGDGVFMDRYYFKRDPRVCQPEKPEKPQIALKELITRHPNHRLLVFTDAEGFIDPLTGKLHGWIDTLLHWSDTGIFIPERTDGIHYFERILVKSGFQVEPVSIAGLARHIEKIQFDAESARFDWDMNSPYPRLFEDKKDLWLQHAEPDQKDIDELIAALQDYPGEEGIQWLGGCAVYPELHWKLTLYLATKLKLGDKDTLTAEEQDSLRKKLLELIRLPWFRYGSMPDWLRLCLIKILQKKNQHHQIRRIIRELLSTARKDYREGFQKSAGAIKLPVAWKSLFFHVRYLKRKVTALFQRGSDDNPLNDYVFSHYMSSGRSLLAVIIPDRVKHLFFRKGQAILGLKPAAGIIMAVAVSALTFTAVQWFEPHLAVVNPIPEFAFVKKASLIGVDGPAGVSRENIDVCLRRFMEYRGIPVTTGAEDAYRQVYPQFTGWLAEILSEKAGLDTTQFKFYTGLTGTPESNFKNVNDKLYVLKKIIKVAEKDKEPEVPKKTTEVAVTFNIDRLNEDMVFIKGGCFNMGDRSGDGYDDEKPLHQVCVSNFSIGKYEVTQGQWREIMGRNPSGFQKGDDYPVEKVSWNDVQEFIRRLNEKTGKNYRLPTEAEWEYAARAGSTTRYPCGDEEKCLDAIAWYDANSGNTTHPIGKKLPNAWGLYDMIGNVWEWVEDDWHDSYVGAPVNGSAWIDTKRGSYRVFRGGGWGSDAGFCRSSSRSRYVPSYASYNVGFRLVLPQVIREVTQGAEAERSPGALRDEGRTGRSGDEAQQVKKTEAKPPLSEIMKMEFVEIPAGEFLMGSPKSDKEARKDEMPQHKVIIENGFSMQKTEVTQGQWREIMGRNPSGFQKGDDYPVESVSWNDVQEFIKKLNEKMGKNYRLPTEAEWEYAARAGSTTRYPCGDDEKCLDAIAWYDTNSGNTTHPVGKKLPNTWGLYDMIGNAWEWCQDWYDEKYYKKSPLNDPKGPEAGSYRVIRGGSWDYFAWYCRSSSRYFNDPSGASGSVGFRLVLPQVISEVKQGAKAERSPGALRDKGRKR